MCVSRALGLGKTSAEPVRNKMLTQTASNAAHRRVTETVQDRIGSAGLWRAVGTQTDSARTHRISPDPFELTPSQFEQISRLGPALLRFYAAANQLYLRSEMDWVREYLELGKGEEIIRHGLMNYQKRALPRVIRPDILVTQSGLKITELDSVPGGMGQLDCLSAAYSEAGFEPVGGARGMRDGFAAMIRDTAQQDNALCAIVVSEESADYLPEMSYLAGELRKAGLHAYAVRPQDIEFTENGLFVAADSEGETASVGGRRVDVVYRFFELFDLPNIPKSELVAYAAKKRRVAVTPPYKHFLEEKMLLALLHHDALAGFWNSALGEDDLALLRSVIAPTFILDNRPVPPHARVSGFEWRGGPIRDWSEIKDGTQKERRLVIKPSGFSPLAWGSRGVKIGHDMSGEDWAAAVDEALDSFGSSPHVLQPFEDSAVLALSYWNEAKGEPVEMRSRVRLCPYYFVVREEARLGGVLATAVPHDKKLIHGMVDSVMSPCVLGKEK